MNVEQTIQGEVRRQKSDTSDVSFADIPEEVQIDILSRLSPTSLSRCKCVSKHWNDSLTIQAFLLKRSIAYNKHPKRAFVARSISYREGSVVSFELNDDNTPKTMMRTVETATTTTTTTPMIRGRHVYFNYFLMNNSFDMSDICNDLICLFQQSSTLVGLLNIRTGDFIQLPAITSIKSDGYVSRSWYALGFDPVHNVFKVLSIIYKRTSKECTKKAAILTVGSKYWNPIDYKCLPSSVTKSFPWQSTTNSLCLDGMIYWVHVNNVGGLTVTAFDLNRETFRDHELVMTSTRDGAFRYYLTSLKERPTLFVWKVYGEEVEQWTLFNHKNPNAAWKSRNLTKHNFPKMTLYGFPGVIVAGSSTLLHYSDQLDGINLEYWWYSWYDLENFALE
ncbi:putative F-box protein At1g53550 [Silene latifolia]|uniref:putative F-box protein At1g53550 n=1 Tax=Silene latifolia TaxID=37657 RepID=UPI003D7845F5